MHVTAVLVTYGDRSKLVKQVVRSCIAEGIARFVIVDNASSRASRNALEVLARSGPGIEYIRNERNLGSAGGYTQGLKHALADDGTDFIWLLDDDNEPQPGSLAALLDAWRAVDGEKRPDRISLLSLRPDRAVYQRAVAERKPDRALGPRNSFLGFHVQTMPRALLDRMFRKQGVPGGGDEDPVQGSVSVAPYGGMFFRKDLLDVIGFPNIAYFLYADDHEWTYRITRSGGEIRLVTNSTVLDIDQSWNVSEGRSNIFSLIAGGSPFRVYYGMRNRMYFEEEALVSNKFVYAMNRLLFLLILRILHPGASPGTRAFERALRDKRDGIVGEVTGLES